MRKPEPTPVDPTLSPQPETSVQPVSQRRRGIAVAIAALSVVGVGAALRFLGGDSDASAARHPSGPEMAATTISQADETRQSGEGQPILEAPNPPLAEYVLSKERNDAITPGVQDISDRVLRDANAHPERTKFDDLSDGKEGDQKGALVETFNLADGSTIRFTVSVKVGENGSYSLDPGDNITQLRSEFSGPSRDGSGANIQRTIDYVRAGIPTASGALPWAVTDSLSTVGPDDGNGSGGSSAWDTAVGSLPGFGPDPKTLTPQDFAKVEQSAASSIADFAQRAGI